MQNSIVKAIVAFFKYAVYHGQYRAGVFNKSAIGLPSLFIANRSFTQAFQLVNIKATSEIKAPLSYPYSVNGKHILPVGRGDFKKGKLMY